MLCAHSALEDSPEAAIAIFTSYGFGRLLCCYSSILWLFRSRFSHAPPHFVAMWKLLDGRRVDVFTSLNHNVHVKISCLLRNDLKLQHFENWIFQSQIQFLVKLWTFWKFEKFFKYLNIEKQKSLKNSQNLKILTNLKKNSRKMKLKDFFFGQNCSSLLILSQFE